MAWSRRRRKVSRLLVFGLTIFFEGSMVGNMTLQEFEKFRLSIEQQKFQADSLDPLRYGIQRDVFRKDKLKRLISTGAKVNSKTVQAKVARWKRQLTRLDKSQARLEKLRSEIAAGKLQVSLPKKPAASIASSSAARA